MWDSAVIKWIIGCAGALAAIKVIYDFIRNNTAAAKAKAKQTFDEQFSSDLKQQLPSILAENNKSLIAELAPKFELLSAQINEQNDKIDLLSEDMAEVKSQITLLNTSTLDMMREEMQEIFNRCKADKKIARSDLQTWNRIYADYTAMGGNSHFHDLNDCVQAWDIYEDY